MKNIRKTLPPRSPLKISSNKLGFIQHQLRRSGAGFTLIELLVVITVLGVLATIVLLAVNPGAQLARARDAGRKTALRQIANGLERYYVLNGKYPLHCDATTVDSTQAQPWIPELVNELKPIPVDPINKWIPPFTPGSKTSWYQYQSKKLTKNPFTSTCIDQYYTLGAHLEDPSDKDINWDFTDYWGGWAVNFIVKNYDF